MSLINKHENYDNILELVHDIRREQIQFNDTVSSSLINRNKALNVFFSDQIKKTKILFYLSMSSIVIQSLIILIMIQLFAKN